jgi:hypothetical protein
VLSWNLLGNFCSAPEKAYGFSAPTSEKKFDGLFVEFTNAFDFPAKGER